jgi:hypothetical protein
LHILAVQYGSWAETFQGRKRRGHARQPIDEGRRQLPYEAEMQVTRIPLNDDAADHHIKLSKNKIEMIRHLRLACPHYRSALTDLDDEATKYPRVTHPFSGEEQIAQQRDAAAVPFTAEVVGFDTTEISASLVGLHWVTSMLAKIPMPVEGKGRGSSWHRLDRHTIKRPRRQI